MVIVGDPDRIVIPELGRIRQKSGRLRGLRLLHTHLGKSGLTQEDLMDLVFLRLDSIGVLTAEAAGNPLFFQWAHLLPPNQQSRLYHISEKTPWDQVDVDFNAQIEALETELIRHLQGSRVSEDSEKALLIGVGTEPKHIQSRSLEELGELASTAGLEVTDTLVQRVSKIHPHHILGKGKLAELEVLALQTGATALIFDRELSPAQMRNLAHITERKIVDRTQVILDIFSQHATSKAGKMQVEMAQLDYTLPRLVGKNRALSRLAGGIGGRGPGETKLELDRRKIKDRRTKINKELSKIRKHREFTRLRRSHAGLPIVALVGYTNAGKSTLLNTLTHSSVHTADKLFATLDPTSRRLRFPEDREIILTDTVGFIRYLPDNLKEAFLATLEELHAADILVQVADASHPEVETQIQAVQGILEEMGLQRIPRLLALNKWDLVPSSQRPVLRNRYPTGICVSATRRDTLEPLIDAVVQKLPASYDFRVSSEDMNDPCLLD